jgi:DNA-binding beta-propeller fold protein YncE
VFDARTNKLIHTIPGLEEPHAMLYRADLHRLFVVDGGASEIKIYNSETYALQGSIKLSIDADSIAYDPKTTYLYVVNGGREAHTPYSLISVVDTTKAEKVADIKIDSNWLEAMALEHEGARLFISETGSNQVGVMDRNSRNIIASWPIPVDTRQNSAMKFDEANHRLLIATRKSPKFIVMDSDTGKVIASMDCVPMVDDIAYDPKSKRIYVSGDKVVDIIQQQDADHYKKIGEAVGSSRAKTALLVPELGRYYLAAPKDGANAAKVLVYKAVR